MTKQLPPFGKQFKSSQKSGIRVAIGPSAWGKAKAHAFPIMVLPQDKSPSEYRWPSDGGPALIFECGEFNDDRLDSMAAALLRAGCPSAIAIREALSSLKTNDDPRVFFYPEVTRAAAA